MFLRASGDYNLKRSPVHVIEWVCKSQRHVCRSTFAAELLSACDAADQGVLVSQMIHEITHGPSTAEEARRRILRGGFAPVGLYVDAKSVYAAVSATFVKTPAEKSLLTHVQFLREALERGMISVLLWIDTRDMISDGLTKGSVGRELLHLCMDGTMNLQHESDLWKPRITQSVHDQFEHSSLFLDLAEAFAGRARISRYARNANLQVAPPADILYDWDLSTPDGARHWRDQVLHDKPLVIVIGFSCTLWCNFTKLNYAHRQSELAELRDRDRSLLRLMTWTMHYQHDNNRYFMFENPPTSAIWREPHIHELCVAPHTFLSVTHACAYGKVDDVSKLPLWKEYKWLCNSQALANSVAKKCPGHHEHATVSGTNTKSSGEYPDGLARAIAAAVGHLRASADGRSSA